MNRGFRTFGIRNDSMMWSIAYIVVVVIGMLYTITSSVTVSTALVAVVPESSTLSQRQIYNTARSQTKNCIIVGGGPIGLASAYTLARSPHNYNVTILESSTSISSNYNPSRAYLYNINSKGLDWFLDANIAPQTAYTNLLHMGYSPGVDSFGQYYVIPSDPNKPIANAKAASVAVSSSDTNKNNNNNNNNYTSNTDTRRPSYWIQRHQMLDLLYKSCLEHNTETTIVSSTTSTGSIGQEITKIEILPNKTVTTLYPHMNDDDNNSNNNEISVQCNDGTIYTGSLIVAADGINSAVRSCLAGLQQQQEQPKENTYNSSSWLQSNPLSFRVRKFKSPSTGLKLKALQFRPNFKIPNGTIVDNNNITTTQYFIPSSTDIVSIRGKNHGLRNKIFIGLFPINDATMIRPGSTITPYNHEIWSLQNGIEAKQWFTKAFPRIFTTSSSTGSNDSTTFSSDNNTLLINDDVEWERFVQANGTTFPYCQYSPGSIVTSPNDLCGVVMVGDACHAFPPDMGQGINAGFQDVLALDRSLRNVDIITGETKDNTSTDAAPPTITLGTALRAYQKNRRPEHEALIRLMRFGGPYQYRQPWLRHRIGAFIWTMNVLFRFIMNKMTFGLIPPVIAFIPASNQALTYRQIMRRADSTAFGFQFIFYTLLLRWILVRPSMIYQTIKSTDISANMYAGCTALIILKVIIPLRDQIECYLRREKRTQH